MDPTEIPRFVLPFPAAVPSDASTSVASLLTAASRDASVLVVLVAASPGVLLSFLCANSNLRACLNVRKATAALVGTVSYDSTSMAARSV